jgi:hypothetical protein
MEAAGSRHERLHRITLAGGVEKQSHFGSQTTDAGKDENAVIVRKSQEQVFLTLRAAIEDAIAHRHAPVGVPAAQAPITTGPPPGWYADPDGGSHKRWWDGTTWTEHRQA